MLAIVPGHMAAVLVAFAEMGRDSREQQRRKRNEAASARDGIQRTRDQSSKEEESSLAQKHAQEYLFRPMVSLVF